MAEHDHLVTLLPIAQQGVGHWQAEGNLNPPGTEVRSLLAMLGLVLGGTPVLLPTQITDASLAATSELTRV